MLAGCGMERGIGAIGISRRPAAKQFRVYNDGQQPERQ
jgi:hypothetical protein